MAEDSVVHFQRSEAKGLPPAAQIGVWRHAYETWRRWRLDLKR